MNYLQQYLDLNELDFDLSKIDISKDIINYSKYWYIVQGYKDLQENKISLEDFFSLGDIFSTKNLENWKAFGWLEIFSRVQNEKNKMYLIDKLAYDILKIKKLETKLKNNLQKQNSIIIIL